MTNSDSSDFSAAQEIKVRWRTDSGDAASRAADLSVTGAFITTPDPLPAGATLGLHLEVNGREISVQAVVRRVIPGEGMGVEFHSLSADDRARLDLMVRRAELQEAAQTADSGKPPAAHPTGRVSRMQRGAERRTRARYKFSAPALLVESGAKQSVPGRVGNLGVAGCFVHLSEPFPPGTSLEITIAHNGQSLHTTAIVKSSQSGKGMGLSFAELAPQDRQVLADWLAVASERAWLATNRRRGQRVIVSIPVRVEAKDPRGGEHVEETKTLSVSASGALLSLKMDVCKGQTLTLRDPVTHDSMECSVDYLGAESDGRREVGISFVVPNRNLWRIAFPPADWSAHDPYAKGGA